MANVNIKDGSAASKYLKASGAGSDGDPFVPEHSLAAGANAIGKLAANSGVDIGDVDVTSVTPGIGASNLGKAEDALHASGDVGVMALVVRKDSGAAIAGADGDYSPLQVDANGALRVTGGAGGTSMTDDAAFTPASSSLTPVGGTYRSVRDAVDDNDGGAFAMTSKRALFVSVETPAGDSAMDDTNDALKTVLSTALPAGANAIGKLAANSGVDIGDVDVTSGPTGASAFQVQGTVAHGSAAANNPILNGGYAASADPAVVDTGDIARLLTDLVGKLITLPYAIPENFIAGKAGPITDTTRTQIIAAQGAGVRIYVTHILVTNSHATVGTVVKIEDGTTEIYRGYAAPAGGGFSCTLNVPLRGTANTALQFSAVTTGASIDVSASGYKGA